MQRHEEMNDDEVKDCDDDVGSSSHSSEETQSDCGPLNTLIVPEVSRC